MALHDKEACKFSTPNKLKALTWMGVSDIPRDLMSTQRKKSFTRQTVTEDVLLACMAPSTCKVAPQC